MDNCDLYAFPRDLIGLSDGKSSALSLSNGNGINSDATSFGFKSLRSLAFNCVNVSGEVLEFFLHNCPFLESMLVECSYKLEEFKVCGPSLALKHLEIMYCTRCSLTICDTNIVSLKTTKGHNLVLKNVPMLVDVFIGGDIGWTNFLNGAISWLSCCLLKLEVLTLRMMGDQMNQYGNAALPQLTQLKQLTFYVFHPTKYGSLIRFTPLIRAAPNLEKFVLKLQYIDDPEMRDTDPIKGTPFPLKHIKVIEFWGYSGSTMEVELVEYFVENGVALERVVIDPRNVSYKGLPLRVDDVPFNYETVYRKRANTAKDQLSKILPQHIELVLL